MSLFIVMPPCVNRVIPHRRESRAWSDQQAMIPVYPYKEGQTDVYDDEADAAGPLPA